MSQNQESTSGGVNMQELRKARRQIRKHEEEILGLKTRLRKLEAGGGRIGVIPENIVWVFGSGRTGSSWLTFIMALLPKHSRWNEPLVGYLFGNLYYTRASHRQDTSHFILGNHHRETWIRSARELLLDGATERFPQRVQDGYLVIKEPHGTNGAPLLMEAVPESRMIFLVRDPRDVAASKLAAHKPGSWAASRTGGNTESIEQQSLGIAAGYSEDIRRAFEAYKAHAGYKTFVRYEDLRADTLENMMRMYSELGIPVEEERMKDAVEKRRWENIPDEEKGEDKIRRKAKPGGWKEDLTPKSIEIVERESAWILDEFYAGR